jgi:hypothetical protein
MPDWQQGHRERRCKGVILFLRWQEYKAVTPEVSSTASPVQRIVNGLGNSISSCASG